MDNKTSSIPPDYLKLVPLSDPPQKYEYIVRICTPIRSETPENHPAYATKSAFEQFRVSESLTIRAEDMQRHLEQQGVINYNYQYTNQTVDFFFATVFDANIARMMFMPEKPYEISLSPSDPDASLKDVEKIMRKFQRQFNRASIGQHIVLELNREKKQILAIAANRRALIDMIGNEYEIGPQILAP